MANCTGIATALGCAGVLCGCEPKGAFRRIQAMGELRDHLTASDTRPVLVVFYLPSCPACGMSAGPLTRVSEAYQDRATFLKVDGSQVYEAASAYSVVKYPTVILFAGGLTKERWVNKPYEHVYRQALDKCLAEQEKTKAAAPPAVQ